MYFNPPAPWGAGPTRLRLLLFWLVFQSTRPVGGGTGGNAIVELSITISIHPPRGGRDLSGHLPHIQASDFNPPAPWGAGPPTNPLYDSLEPHFNPPAPWGAGPHQAQTWCLLRYFNPPAPWGAGQQNCTTILGFSCIFCTNKSAFADFVLHFHVWQFGLPRRF